MRKFIVLQLILVTISSFGQSPWTQKKGKVFSHLSLSTISGYNSLFGNPDFNTERKISDKTLQLFTEYGVSDKTSLLINIPFKMIETGALVNEVSAEITTSSNKNTFGNINIGLKHNFINKKWLMSGQFLVEANTSSYESSSGIRTGFDAWSFSPMLIVGRSFNKTYLQSYTGFELRTNDYSSNFRIGGEVGRKVGSFLWLIGFIDISSSLKNGDVNLPIENSLTGLYVNDQEFGSFGLKAIGEINNKTGITAGFGSAFSGNNVPKKAAISFGIYKKF